MTLQGENITLGLKLNTATATYGLDYYFGFSYGGSETNTQSGVLMEYQRETLIWEKSSYHQSEVIEYLNVYNNDTITHKVKVFLGIRVIGEFELFTKETLVYVNGVGFSIKDANGLVKVLPAVYVGGGGGGSSMTEVSVGNADVVAADNNFYTLPDAVLTHDINFDVSALNSTMKHIYFLNNNLNTYRVMITGSPVVWSNGEAVTEIRQGSIMEIIYVDGRLTAILG